MASNITISAGVRQNLLALQNTASLLSSTQNRLATGKKVNSALDNPTNFFTSASLSSRASDLSGILDSMANGISTLKAADNGLTAITHTVESMQATINQARQDSSFKSTSYGLDSARSGNLTISGGAVSGSVNVSLGSTPTATTLNGSGATFGTNFAGGNITVNGTTVAIRGDSAATATTLSGAGANFATNFTGGNVQINGTTVAIRGDSAATAATVAGAGGTDLTGDPDLSALTGESVTISDGTNTATYTFDGNATGQKAALLSALGTNGFTATGTANGLSLSRADGTNFTVTTSNSAVATAIGIANNTATTNGVAAFDATATTVKADIDGASIAGLTSAVSGGGQVNLSLASGAALNLTGGNTLLTAIGYGTGNQSSTNGTAAFDATAATVKADLDGAAITGLTTSVSGGGQVNLSLASGDDITLGGGGTLLTAIGYGTGNQASTNGTPTALNTVDQLVTAINANSSLTGKVKATNDNGKLNITNLSTEDLTLTGVASDGEVDGGVATSTVGGNTVRKNLISQFNDLRSQLDKLADDSSFNGINLLHGDTLKLTFNETNSSSISIVSQNASGINSSVLGLGAANGTEFSDNSALDTRLEGLHTALTQLRSQSSAFGSNLSIVQNRQDFTKNMINTLQTGSDALTLADSNEEAANLLALQTRQQLSTTALSLASQADQAVLRLF